MRAFSQSAKVEVGQGSPPGMATHHAMDWDRHLAAALQCTDAHLAQRFQQLSALQDGDGDDVGDDAGSLFLEFAPEPVRPLPAAPRGARTAAPIEELRPLEGPSIAAAFLREAAPAATFSEHFRRRQQQRKQAARAESDNQQPAEEHVDERPQSGQGYAHGRPVSFQTFASPSYDVAHMMEQVRLSLKLEVDARAAIAERQLGALLQLSKASGDELDRLRVEVAAGDRQLHSLEQTQHKLRQEVATQKDIAFHLQALCGKDETWRMQAESQLLELRQMVAALREQANATQVSAQEKLSRNELLVHFNAAMEPVKAQLQAATHHQTQQIGEVSRSASSSALLLDAVMQKINHALPSELADLRNDVSALKVHISKLAGGRIEKQREDEEQVDAAHSKREREALARNEQHVKEVVDRARRDITSELRAFVTDELKLLQRKCDELTAGSIRRLDVESMLQRVEDRCSNQVTTATTQAEKQIKTVESQLHTEFGRGLLDLLKQIEQTKSALSEAAKTADARAESWESRYLASGTRMDKELEDRRVQLSENHERLRVVQSEAQQAIQNLTQDMKLQQSQATHDGEKRLREAEKRTDEQFEKCLKESRSRFAELEGTIRDANDKVLAKCDRRIQAVEHAMAKINTAMDALGATIKDMKDAYCSNKSNYVSDRKATSSSPGREDIRAALEKQTCAFVSAIDTSMQRMQLQLQLQLQAQSHPPVTAASATQSQPALSPRSPVLTTVTLPPASIATRAPAALTVAPTSTLSTTTVTPSSVPAIHESSSVVSRSDTSQTQVSPITKVDLPTQLLEVPGGSLKIAPDAAKHSNATSAVHPPVDASSKLPPEPRPSSDKIQETITTSSRGAQAEAELAKARVESRRKQEQELRQNPTSPTSTAPVMRGPPTPASQLSVEPSSGRVPPPPPAPPLMRAGSASVLSLSSQESSIQAQSSPGRRASISPGANSSQTVVGNPAPPSAQNSAMIKGSTTSSLTMKVSLAPPQSSPISRENKDVKETPSATSEARNEPHAILPAKLPQNEPQRQNNIELEQVGALASSPSTGITENLSSETRTESSAETPTPNSPSVMVKLFGNLPKSPSQDGLAATKSPPPPPPPVTAAPAARPDQIVVPSTSNKIGSSSPAHVLCCLCRLPIRKEQREEHENKQCPRRLVECTTCNAKMLWINLEVHAKTCSMSGTENPSDNTVPQSSSISTSSNQTTALETNDTTKKCRHCSADMVGSELLDHETRCDKVLKQCPHCLRRQKMSELQEHIDNCDCRLVSCPNDCGGKFLQRGIEKHLATRCPKSPGGSLSHGSLHGETSGQSTPSTPTASKPAPPTPIISSTAKPQHVAVEGPRSSSTGAGLGTVSGNLTPSVMPTSRPGSISDSSNPVERSTASNAILTSSATASTSQSNGSSKITAKAECKFCDEEFPADTIDAHETDCDWRPKRCQHCNMVIISRDLVRHEASCKTSFKSCQHCNESMPQSALSTHSTRCTKRPIKCIRCCQLFPADAIVAHSTSCKFVPTTTATGVTPPPPSQLSTPGLSRASSGSISGSQPPNPAPSVRVPPPPPYPPATIPSSTANGSTRLRTASADPSMLQFSRTNTSNAMPPDESTDARMARRSLALSQLTNPGASGSNVTTSGARSASEISAVSGAHPEMDDDGGDVDDEENEESGAEDEEDELTLAEVVAEWTVENVCVWLHEDVGVPDVVSRFQQRRCTGAMLLELTESDLVNDFGIRNRIHRERILNAIEAVKMSDSMSEDDDDDEDYMDDDDDEHDVEDEDDNDGEDGGTAIPNYGDRGTQIPSQRQAGEQLPSSNAMFRRINSALDIPKK